MLWRADWAGTNLQLQGKPHAYSTHHCLTLVFTIFMPKGLFITPNHTHTHTRYNCHRYCDLGLYSVIQGLKSIRISLSLIPSSGNRPRPNFPSSLYRYLPCPLALFPSHFHILKFWSLHMGSTRILTCQLGLRACTKDSLVSGTVNPHMRRDGLGLLFDRLSALNDILK